MRRRALIAGFGVLSAGCLGAAPRRADDPTSTPTNNETPASPSSCSGENEPSTGDSNESTTTGEYRVTDLSQSATTDGPSFEYVLEPSAFYSASAVENEEEQTGEDLVVEDVSTIEDDAVREAIVTAIRTGRWRSNTLPDGLADTVERVDFFKGVTEDETHTHVGLTLYQLDPDRQPAIEFDVTVVDDLVSSGSPGVIELALTNTASTARSVFSGTVPPFGMVTAKAVGEDDQFLLWRNYEKEGSITFDEEGWTRWDVGVTTELQSGERIARQYEILPSETICHPEFTAPPGPGQYRYTDSLEYTEEHGAPESMLSFEVEFSLESVDSPDRRTGQ